MVATVWLQDTTINQYLVAVIEGMMKRMHGWGKAYGGVLFLCSGQQIEQQKIYKSKIRRGLRWPPFNFFHTKTNQIHTGMIEEGWDRMHNWAGMLGERNSIVLGTIQSGEGTKLK